MQLFAFGIDPPEGQLPSDVAWDWPRVSEVQSYNRRVRQTLDKVLDDAPEHLIRWSVCFRHHCSASPLVCLLSIPT